MTETVINETTRSFDALPDAAKPEHITSVAEVDAWFDALHREGLEFHLDDDLFEVVTDMHYSRMVDDATAVLFNNLRLEAFEVCRKAIGDVAHGHPDDYIWERFNESEKRIERETLLVSAQQLETVAAQLRRQAR